MKTITKIARGILTAIALSSAVLLLGAPSTVPFIGLLAAIYLSYKGLEKLGTFKQ